MIIFSVEFTTDHAFMHDCIACFLAKREDSLSVDCGLESFGFAAIIVNAEQEIVSLNSMAERLSEYQCDELVGCFVDALLSRYPQKKMASAENFSLFHALPSLPATHLLYITTKSGDYVPVEAGIEHWKMKSQAFTTIYLRKTKIENHEKQGKATRLDIVEISYREKSKFVANMSHELRTPMVAILGFCELALDPNQDPPDRLHCIQTILRNGQHLLKILDDILDFAKSEAGKLKIEKVTFPLHKELMDTLAFLHPSAVEKRLKLNIEYKGMLPEVIESDPNMLRQILVNIISNAIKFTSRGSIDLLVECKHNKSLAKRQLHIAVRDSGIGIEKEEAERIFMPFYQCENYLSSKNSGTGLGLSLSRQLAVLLGGGLVLTQSEKGIGSIFELTIDPGPLQGVRFVDEDKYLSSFGPSKLVTFARSNKLAGFKMLIAENNLECQNLIYQMIEYAGGEADVAKNGREVIERVKQQDYDLILINMQMPSMDGYLATTQLRFSGYKKPIIALISEGMKESRIKSLRVGCDTFLSKPVDAEQLIDTILWCSHLSI